LTEKYFAGDMEDEKLSQYMTNIDCPDCDGYRLNKESLSVYFQ
jgi:excinuclease UvrABC ATPase subunit